jgi:hypothetical protein
VAVAETAQNLDSLRHHDAPNQTTLVTFDSGKGVAKKETRLQQVGERVGEVVKLIKRAL